MFLVVVATPLLLLSAPLPYLSALAPAQKSAHHASLQSVDVERVFAIVDLNGDGKIDRRELAKLRLPRERPDEART